MKSVKKENLKIKPSLFVYIGTPFGMLSYIECRVHAINGLNVRKGE